MTATATQPKTYTLSQLETYIRETVTDEVAEAAAAEKKPRRKLHIRMRVENAPLEIDIGDVEVECEGSDGGEAFKFTKTAYDVVATFTHCEEDGEANYCVEW